MMSASVSAGLENHSAASSAGRMCDKSDLANPTTVAVCSNDPAGIRTSGGTQSSVVSLSSSSFVRSGSVTQLPPPEFADFPFDGSSSAVISNGRPPSTIIPMSSTSFRPVSTLPRRTAAPSSSACANEMSSSQQQHHPGSLNRKANKVASSAAPTGGNLKDELRV